MKKNNEHDCAWLNPYLYLRGSMNVQESISVLMNCISDQDLFESIQMRFNSRSSSIPVCTHIAQYCPMQFYEIINSLTEKQREIVLFIESPNSNKTSLTLFAEADFDLFKTFITRHYSLNQQRELITQSNSQGASLLDKFSFRKDMNDWFLFEILPNEARLDTIFKVANSDFWGYRLDPKSLISILNLLSIEERDILLNKKTHTAHTAC